MDARVLRQGMLVLGLGMAWGCAAEEMAVYHCRSAAGVPVYSDQPCGAGTVMMVDVEGRQAPERVDSSAAPGTLGGTRGVCPAPSAQDLPGAVSAAFASGDVNRFASLYHWTGLTSADARRMFGRFDELLAQPLQNVGVGSAIHSAGEAGFLGVADAPGATMLSGAGELWLEVGPVQAPRQVRFRIVENAGCAWLRFG